MATQLSDAPMLALIDVPGTAQPTVKDQALVVLTNAEAFDNFYERMKAETDRHVPDVSTDKGRKAIIALARRVTTTKTAITAAAKGLTEGWREQTAQVNAARRPIEEQLAALAEEVRRPVTEWEAAEASRVERNRAAIAEVRAAAVVTSDDTTASVEERGRRIHEMTIGKDWSDAEAAEFGGAQRATVEALVAARNRLRQEEADRAELEKLRAAEAERQRVAEQERIAREAREAEEQAARDAEAAEARRIAEEQIAQQREADRLAALERAAEQRAREEAERQAQAERDRVQAEHEAALQAERDRVAAVEREREEERQRVAAAERQRVEAERVAQAERDRQAAEDARRAANRAHVGKIMGAAKEAIMTTGVTEDQARAIVVAIKAGLVPNVGITF